MKKIFLIAAAGMMTLSALAQPQLRKDNIDEVIKAMTLEEKATLLVGGARAVIVDGVPTGTAAKVPGAAGNTRPIERLGIPGTVLADGPAGLRISPTRQNDKNTYYATGFPVGTLLASSWDVDLVTNVTKAMGEEVHEYGVDVLLAPGMNIHRNPLCGRNFEYFSEDPVLSGKMAAAYVNGIQSNDVGVSIKHYAVNNQETNRNEDNARVSERALREIYLKNFEIAVKESAPWTVMSSYNKLNGEYTQQKHDLLTGILRDEWGYKGIVMTDWGNKAGTVKSAWAGNDLMEPGNQNEIDRIVAGVKDGSLKIEDVDRNVRNMLNYIVKTPSFKNYKYSNKPDLKGHAEVARKAAAEAMVLLRNENNTLPIKDAKKVALYGITALDFVADTALGRSLLGRLEVGFGNIREENDDEGKREDGHGDEQGRIGVGNLGIGRISDQVADQHGANRGGEGVAGTTPLNQLVATVAATAEGVEHRVDDGVEHAHREAGDEGAEKIDAEAFDYAREEGYAHADKAHQDGGQCRELIALLRQDEACGKAHHRIGDEVGGIAELRQEVRRAELALDDNTEGILQAGHEGNHREQEEHDRNRKDIGFFLFHLVSGFNMIDFNQTSKFTKKYPFCPKKRLKSFFPSSEPSSIPPNSISRHISKKKTAELSPKLRGRMIKRT